MSVISDAARSSGDVMREIAELKRQVAALSTARRLEAASVGRGGLRIQGGRLLAEDQAGDRVFEVTTDPASIFMREELISQLSLAILANRLTSRTIPLSGGSVSDPGSTYVAADGPSLSNVEVSETGACLLLITARIACQINQPNGVSAAGWMSFRVTGASTVEPADDESLNNEVFGPAAEVIANITQATRLVLIEGLNPGTHTIAARYRSLGIDPPPDTSVIFTSRNLTALAL